MRPRFVKSFAQSKRAQGMPGACCTRGLVCKSVQKNAHEHTGTDGAFRHSLRDGLTAYIVLSPATNSSCHRHRRIEDCLNPVGSTRLRRLDTSNGCQDHTVLPYAASRLRLKALPGIGTGRLHAVFAHGSKPALQTRLRARRCRVHRIPSQRS
jgi:hypothetical protein